MEKSITSIELDFPHIVHLLVTHSFVVLAISHLRREHSSLCLKPSFISFTYVVKMQQQVLAMAETLLPQIISTRDSGERQIEWKDFCSIFFFKQCHIPVSQALL